MSRRSMVAVSTLVSELNVLSMILPESTCFSFDLTTVLPLPGLWCWNHCTCHSSPFRSSTIPFLRSLVDTTPVAFPTLACTGRRGILPEPYPRPETAA